MENGEWRIWGAGQSEGKKDKARGCENKARDAGTKQEEEKHSKRCKNKAREVAQGKRKMDEATEF